MKKDVLYFCHLNTSFTKIDTIILSKEFNVIQFVFNIKSPISILWLLIKQKWFLIKNIYRADLLFCMFAGYHTILPVIFSKLFNKPCIIVAGGIDAVSFPSVNYGNFNKRVLGKITALSFKWCSYIAPISDYLVDSPYTYQNNDFKRQGFLFHVKNIKTPYKVVYNGFETHLWYYQNTPRVPNTFLTIAANIENESRRKIKGIDMVLEAARLFPEFSFTIIGCNPQQNVLKLSSNVTLLPFVPHDELREIYCKHDFYLQLSMSEGFGNTLAESMLCGCIPIGANAGAIPFIIGSNGFILKNKEVNELKSVITQAVQYKNKDEMRAKARQSILDNFSIEKRSAALYEIINRLIKS
ncbi:MAG: glycosyltransferase family 4 protein [Bacteroidia bacterium]|nr:glycosyltransferase family 4 protein [Bacteroidia bacterium]MCZ2249066.1 glycosyltransferase family 4 protein [Bacteroidia bacterium]